METDRGIYGRTCQECGHVQAMKPPAECKGDYWRHALCKKCKSEALDYGSWGFVHNSEGRLVRMELAEDE